MVKMLQRNAIVGIILPSVEEYETARDIVPKLGGWWWLRSPGLSGHVAAVVPSDGLLIGLGGVDRPGGSVRPALQLNPESVNLQIGEKIRAAGYLWTVIPGDMALCDAFIGTSCFRKDWKAPDANVYETSDIKRFLEAWARGHGLPVPEAPALNGKIEVPTEMGTIIAEPSGNPEYPGIYISFKPVWGENGKEIVIALAEVVKEALATDGGAAFHLRQYAASEADPDADAGTAGKGRISHDAPVGDIRLADRDFRNYVKEMAGEMLE